MADSPAISEAKDACRELKETKAYNQFSRKREEYSLNALYPPMSRMKALDRTDVFDDANGGSRKGISLFVNIPFCTRRCYYCGYLKNNRRNKDQVSAYLQALKKEMSMYAKKTEGYSIESVYIGGGTPSFLSSDQISELFADIRRNFNVKENIEITFEINPETSDKDKIAALYHAGVNRVNIGVQTFQNHILKAINRGHTIEDAINCYETGRNSNFANINIDVIYGLIDQTLNDWEHNLNMIEKLHPQSATFYYLRFQADTAATKLFEKNNKRYVTEDELLIMHLMTLNHMKKLNYNEHIVDYFIADEKYSHKFNIQVWQQTESFNLLGLGLGSYSYFNGVQYFNISDIDAYITAVSEKGQTPVTIGSRLSDIEKMNRNIFLGLKLGINLHYFEKVFGKPLHSVYKDKVDELISLRVVQLEKEKLQFTHLGRMFADEVAQTLIS